MGGQGQAVGQEEQGCRRFSGNLQHWSKCINESSTFFVMRNYQMIFNCRTYYPSIATVQLTVIIIMHHNCIQCFKYCSYTKIGFITLCLPSVQYCQLVCHVVFLTFRYPTSFTVLFSYRKKYCSMSIWNVHILDILFLGSEKGTAPSLWCL